MQMMKRITMVTLVLLVLAASAALAEPIADKWILTPRVGYAWMSSNDDGDSFTGMVASASIERNVYGQAYALGFSAGYAWATDEVDTEGGIVKIDHTSIPILATFKYMFGNRRWTGHLGFGMGVHISSTKAPDFTWEDESTTGFAMAFPLGVMFWVSENININASYQFNWLLSSYLSDDASQSANLGIGFQF
jgi:opacity protein-like surface antigen